MAAPPALLRTQPFPSVPLARRLLSRGCPEHTSAACASRSPFAGKGKTAIGGEGSTLIPRSSIPYNLLFQRIPASLFSLKQKEMPPSHYSKRQAPAEPGLECCGEKQFAPTLPPALEARPQTLPPASRTPLADAARGPRKTRRKGG